MFANHEELHSVSVPEIPCFTEMNTSMFSISPILIQSYTTRLILWMLET